MAVNVVDRSVCRLAGYSELCQRYGLNVLPNWHASFVYASTVFKKEVFGSQAVDYYPSTYWPGDSTSDHFEFALKYDGVNLSILARLFQAIPEADLLNYVGSRPTGKYARRIWFLYEFLTGNLLPLDDLRQGNYVDLLDPEEYYTTASARRVKRQRINENLLGNRQFCPMVRRTDTLRNYESADLAARCRGLVSSYSPGLLKRALGYLYAKETKSSFEIEHITPNSTRTERFVSLLQLAEEKDFCEKNRLIDLQNRAVDPRFQDTDFRTTQNYVGETVAWQRENIHFVCPKPEDISDLMDGLIEAHKKVADGEVSPVIHAAVIAYGFVFLHPFEDGNGRIHRFLIHNILSQRAFTPSGVIIPISVSMLRNPADYDASLEAFSRPLLLLVDYSLDDQGRMTVHNDTADWYRYIDLTAQAEALFRFIDQTIRTEIARELEFLANYDRTKTAIQEIVDMPDRQIDLFIRFCLQNNGRLSERKRTSHFDFLTDGEVKRMEEAIQEGYGTAESQIE